MFCLVVIGVCAALVLRGAQRVRDHRAWYAAVRMTAMAVALVGVIGVYWRQLPHEVLAFAAFGALTPGLVLGLAMRFGSVSSAGRSVPHHLVNGAAIALGVGAFAWLLPKLPGIVRLYWDGVNGSGYASPSTLWWVLALLAFNTGCMELAYRLLHGSRVAMLRFAENLFTAFDVAIVVVWLGVAADALPGIGAMRPAFMIAGVVVALGVLVALSHAPKMVRQSPSPEPPI